MARTPTSEKKVRVLGHVIGAPPPRLVEPTVRPMVYAVPGFGKPVTAPAVAVSPIPRQSFGAHRSIPAVMASPVSRPAAPAYQAASPAAPAVRKTSSYPKTDEQIAIIAACKRLRAAKNNASLRIMAYAGAGKTSTLIMIAEEGMDGLKGIYVSFNKKTADEARAKFPGSVEPRTLHSLAYKALNGPETMKCNAYTVSDLMAGLLAPEKDCGIVQLTQARLLLRAVTLFCQSADKTIQPGHIEAAADDVVYRIPNKAVEGREAAAVHANEMTRRRNAVKLATKLAPVLWEKLAGFRETGNPTTFDVYLKVFELSPDLIKQAFRYFDYVMLDEAQDTNPVQQSVVVQSGRMVIAVGDSFQQIYQWRGAEDALAKLHGEILYLSQSFRFGYSIAESAWKALMAKPSNRPTVKLRGSKKESVVELVNVAVAPVILCRTNAGLLQAAVYAAKKGRSVHVVGGMEPVSSEIKSAVALLESRTADIQSDVVKRFPTWKDFKAEAESTEDEVLCGLVAAAEDKEVIQDILLLERQHTDSPAAAQTVVSTVHQAKGLEWPIVALHHDFPDENTLERRMMAAQISGNKDLEKSVLESYHIMYVAVTRAQKILRIPARYHGWLGHAACVCR